MYALYHHCNDKDNYHVNDDNDIVVDDDDDDDDVNIDKDDNDDDDDDDEDGDDDLRLILPTTCMSLLNLSINYLKTNFTILCLYSSEADEMAMSQLFCILDTFAGFKRQNLYTR